MGTIFPDDPPFCCVLCMISHTERKNLHEFDGVAGSVFCVNGKHWKIVKKVCVFDSRNDDGDRRSSGSRG